MTFSRLTLGEPRLRGTPKGTPQDPGGCTSTEPQTGSNVLRDPGFEQHLSTLADVTSTGDGLGPTDEHFAGEALPAGCSGSPGFLNPDNSYAGYVGDQYLLEAGWVVFSNGWGTYPINGIVPYPAGRWTVSDQNPRTGSYHARNNWWAAPIPNQLHSTGGFDSLYPMSAYSCDPIRTAGCGVTTGKGWASARCNPGDAVTWGVWSACSDPTVSSAGPNFANAYIGLALSFYALTHSGGDIDPWTETWAAYSGTGYQYFEHTAVAPPLAAWVSAELYTGWDDDVTWADSETEWTYFDVDDCVLEIQP